MSIVQLMEEIASALPERTRRGSQTIREVCLTLDDDGTWSVLAGSHSAVHIGEWGGDFSADGNTPEEALTACAKSIAADGRT